MDIEDIIGEIYKILSICDSYYFSLTNKLINQVFMNDLLWKNYLDSDTIQKLWTGNYRLTYKKFIILKRFCIKRMISETDLYNSTFMSMHCENITSIPDALFLLKNLNILHLTNNKITIIPEEIVQLDNLIELHLSHNDIKIIPKELAELKKLKSLRLDFNQIRFIPKELGNLSELCLLCLESNQITTIPSELCKLTNLSELCVRDNNIDSIPIELCCLRKIKIFHVRGIKSIPQEIIDTFGAKLSKN